MIDAPKGFVFPSEVVRIFLRGFDLENEFVPDWANIAPDDGSMTFDERINLYMQHAFAAVSGMEGLFAWKGDGEPVYLARAMPVAASYPDTLYFSAVTNLIHANRKSFLAEDYGHVPGPGGNPMRLWDSYFERIDGFAGWYALFPEKAMTQQYREHWGPFEDRDDEANNRKPRKIEIRAKLFEDLSADELDRLGPKTAQAFLRTKGEKIGSSSARNALYFERFRRDKKSK